MKTQTYKCQQVRGHYNLTGKRTITRTVHDIYPVGTRYRIKELEVEYLKGWITFHGKAVSVYGKAYLSPEDHIIFISWAIETPDKMVSIK